MASTNLRAEAMRSLVELVHVLPDEYTAEYKDRIDWLKQFLVASGSQTRLATCQVLGQVSAALPPTATQKLIDGLLEMMKLK